MTDSIEYRNAHRGPAKDWPRIDLAGKTFTIPRVCPNCMAPAGNAIKSQYIASGLGKYTRYTMTFYYCDACCEMFRGVDALERDIAKVGNQMLAGFVLIAFLWFGMLGTTIYLEADWAVLLVTGIAAAMVWYLTRSCYRKRADIWEGGRPPLPPNAVGYNPSAYLIGMKGLFSRTGTFSARRGEWLSLLADANRG